MKKIIILILALLFIFIAKPGLIYAWDDCVFGKVNDKYPGDCSRYIDTNNDNICDHSQPAPEKLDSSSDKKNKSNYHLGTISLVLVFIYSLSLFLVKFNKISIRLHYRIWNISLLLSFIAMTALGVFLILKVSYGINIDFISNLTFWHGETAIFFVLISIFHFCWHIPYYKNILNKAY